MHTVVKVVDQTSRAPKHKRSSSITQQVGVQEGNVVDMLGRHAVTLRSEDKSEGWEKPLHGNLRRWDGEDHHGQLVQIGGGEPLPLPGSQNSNTSSVGSTLPQAAARLPLLVVELPLAAPVATTRSLFRRSSSFWNNLCPSSWLAGAPYSGPGTRPERFKPSIPHPRRSAPWQWPLPLSPPPSQRSNRYTFASSICSALSKKTRGSRKTAALKLG